MSANPVDHPELFDSIEVSGVRSPGVVTLSGLKQSEKWDIKEGDGQDGASTTHKGGEISQFSASFYLVKDPSSGTDELAEWDAFRPVLRASVAGQKPIALAIYHPDLAELEIGEVSIKSISGKVHDGKGGATVTVEFLQYRPAKPKVGNPGGASKKAGGGADGEGDEDEYDPNADAKAELDALLDEAGAP